MRYKSLIARVAIIFLLALSFINSYNKTSNFVYADTSTDSWQSVTTNHELVEAFKYYCKSRNLAVEGSVLDAVTTFTTNNFNTICNTLGIDVTALQAHLKRSTDSNGRLQFLFDEFGVTAYNRIFAELLQNNDIEVGDSIQQQTAFDGKFFVDNDGIGALIWVMPSLYNHSTNGVLPIQYGTTYKYDGLQLKSLYDNGVTSATFNLNDNQSITYNINYYANPNRDGMTNLYTIGNVGIGNSGWYFSICYVEKEGYHFSNKIIIYQYNDKYYLGGYLDKQAPYLIDAGWTSFVEITNSIKDDTVNTNIYYTTNNQTINNNNYTNNKQTVINNEGDTYNYNYDDDDPPVNPSPGGGGSGGSGGDTTNVNIDFPNFDFNIPDIDFSLNGLTEKFPFCIPFDMVALLQLLNAEPQAPRIQGQIPFGSFFTWNLDLDFSRFDDFAVIMRGLEFVGFIFFLIGATINIAKG